MNNDMMKEFMAMQQQQFTQFMAVMSNEVGKNEILSQAVSQQSEVEKSYANADKVGYTLAELSINATKQTGFPIHNSERHTIDDIYKSYGLSYGNYYGKLKSIKGKLAQRPNDAVLQYIAANMGENDLPRKSVALGIMFLQTHQPTRQPAQPAQPVQPVQPTRPVNPLVSETSGQRKAKPVVKPENDHRTMDYDISVSAKSIMKPENGRFKGVSLVLTYPLDWRTTGRVALATELALARRETESYLKGLPNITTRMHIQYSVDRVAIFQRMGQAHNKVVSNDIMAVMGNYPLDDQRYHAELWETQHAKTMGMTETIQDKRAELSANGRDYYKWVKLNNLCQCASLHGERHCVWFQHEIMIGFDDKNKALPTPTQPVQPAQPVNGFTPITLS